jgi:hypothetical protein
MTREEKPQSFPGPFRHGAGWEAKLCATSLTLGSTSNIGAVIQGIHEFNGGKAYA